MSVRAYSSLDGGSVWQCSDHPMTGDRILPIVEALIGVAYSVQTRTDTDDNEVSR